MPALLPSLTGLAAGEAHFPRTEVLGYFLSLCGLGACREHVQRQALFQDDGRV